MAVALIGVWGKETVVERVDNAIAVEVSVWLRARRLSWRGWLTDRDQRHGPPTANAIHSNANGFDDRG